MNDHRDTDVYEVNDESGAYKHSPDFLYSKATVLAELVVKGSGDVLERDDLLFRKPSYGDLEDRDTAVTEERKTDYKISEGDLEIDRVISNEETECS